MLNRLSLKIMVLLQIFTLTFAGDPTSAAGVDSNNQSVSPEKIPTPDEALERYTLNLTRQAFAHKAAGTETPFIGRVVDQERVVTVLTQNGTKVVYLLGPAGSGKTALVESIAGDLKGLEIVQLDLAALEAGAQYRGDFKGRVGALLAKLVASQGRLILFVDEFHSLTKVEGLVDQLKPAMARGEISVVGATTDYEFREFVEKDVALTSRAQTVRVEALTQSEALAMLRSRKAVLAKKYGVTILDSTLQEAVRLAQRYYAAEPISRKALQIVDETMSRISTQIRYGSQAARVMESEIKIAENERTSLKTDLPHLADAEKEQAQKRIEDLSKEITRLENALKLEARGGTPGGLKLDIATRTLYEKERGLQNFKAQPGAGEKESIKKIDQLTEEIRVLREKTIPQMRIDWDNEVQERNKDRVIKLDDVRLTVAVDRNVPMNGIGETAEQRVQRFSTLWKAELFGQPHVLEALEKKLLARELGLDPNTDKPISLMFDGAAGTGKTYAANLIAKGLMNNPRAFLYFNMGQYSTSEAAWTLFSPAKGYKDSSDGGILTEAVRQNPYSVLLLDEIEKANRSVDPILLRALETGVIQDNFGRLVDFRSVIMIMTTNMTAEWVFDRIVLSTSEIEKKYGFEPGKLQGLSAAELDATVTQQIKERRFSKEFLSRITLSINFNPINMDVARQLSRREFERQRETLEKERHIKLTFSDSAVEALANIVAKSTKGGREAADSRQNLIAENLLLRALAEQNRVQRGQTLHIDFQLDQGKLGGSYTVSHNGTNLHSVRVNFPVRPTAAASNGTTDAARSRMERAQMGSEALKSGGTGLIDTSGSPLRSGSRSRQR